MQGLIHGDVVIKPGPRPDFYDECPYQHRPINFWQSKTQYAYEFLEGRHARPEDVPAILELGDRMLWRMPVAPNPLVHDTDKHYYVEYVGQIMRDHIFKLSETNVILDALNIVKQRNLPLASVVHGDLTFENIIIREDGHIKFIDPGNARRCRTAYLDRGKLLQSLVMRWEDRSVSLWHANKPWLTPRSWPTWASQLDWAFLVTHWTRLVPHWPEFDICSGFKTLGQVMPRA